jgi:hypothetical protein
MRRIVGYLVWSLIAMLGISAGALSLAIEDQPRVSRTARIAPEHIERAKQILDRNDPRDLMPGEVRTVTITQEDLDLAVLYLANRYARGSSRLELRPGAMHVAMSTELPRNPLGHFLNADAVLVQSAGLPRFASLEIGRLPIPAWLANWLLGRGLTKLREREDYRLAMDCIGKVSVADGGLSVTFQWHPELPVRMRIAAIPPEDQARLHVYQTRLAETSRDLSVAGPVSLATLMQPLLRLAGQRAKDGDAVAENRAVILVLTFYVNGKRLEVLVPQAKAWPRPVPHAVTLSGRGDFPKHFIVSAALAAYAGEPLADAIGVYKEVADSRGGSGFSFNDVAADRAGSRFGTLAAASPASARKLQDRMSAQLRESDIMPATGDLPEFMPEPEFLRRFGGVDAPAYRQMMAEIERRVAALSFNR